MIDFIILGAQKAATSALQDSLRAHPSIYMPPGESPFFEDPDFDNKKWLEFGNGDVNALVKGIKRPDYLCSDLSRQRIREVLPDCKFIVVLREPVSRAISSYCYMVRHAHLPAKPLNEGMLDCIKAFNRGENSRAASVISYGLYGLHLTKWFDLYGRDKFVIFSQEDVGNRLVEVVDICLEHIGVKAQYEDNYCVKSKASNVGLYDPMLLKIARIASIIKTKRIPGSERRIPRMMFLRILGRILSKSVELIAQKKSQEREVLNRSLTEVLESIYKEDSQILIQQLPLNNIKWL